uniref:Uncharacterized protein n=1 Tax=Oryza brachyantha TaxID=4533 RepID=J3LK92_ORYBR
MMLVCCVQRGRDPAACAREMLMLPFLFLPSLLIRLLFLFFPCVLGGGAVSSLLSNLIDLCRQHLNNS